MELLTKKLGDITYIFENTSGCSEDTVVYSYTKDFGNTKPGDLAYGFTTINVGDINGECYMTKGHYHTNKTPEIYYIIKGTGKLLLHTEEEEQLLPFKAGDVLTIPGEYAHRIINSGEESVEFLSVYPSDTICDYNLNFKTKVFR